MTMFKCQSNSEPSNDQKAITLIALSLHWVIDPAQGLNRPGIGSVMAGGCLDVAMLAFCFLFFCSRGTRRRGIAASLARGTVCGRGPVLSRGRPTR